MSTEAVIVDVVRTPVGRGKPGGILSGVHPVDLLAGVLQALVDPQRPRPRADRRRDRRLRQPGRRAGLQHHPQRRARRRLPRARAGHHASTGSAGRASRPPTSPRRACSPGAYDIVIACGVESMSRVPIGSSAAGADPYGSRIARALPRRAREPGHLRRAHRREVGLDRASELDAFAARSHRLAAAAATEAGAFATELVPVPGVDALTDETVRPAHHRRRRSAA